MNERERFLFDLRGYLVLQDALTPEEVAAGNAAVERHVHLVHPRPDSPKRRIP